MSDERTVLTFCAVYKRLKSMFLTSYCKAAFQMSSVRMFLQDRPHYYSIGAGLWLEPILHGIQISNEESYRVSCSTKSGGTTETFTSSKSRIHVCQNVFWIRIIVEKQGVELEWDFKKAELKWNDIHTQHYIFLYKFPINMDYYHKHEMILIFNAWNDILYI